MRLLDALLVEFDHETGVTRQLLQLVTEDRAGFRPHPKSYSLGELCLHLGRVLGWTGAIVRQAGFDLHPPDTPPAERPRFESMAIARAEFERQAREARAALAAASDAELLETWSLRDDGKLLFTLPRAAVLRSWVFNHGIHHRGQLTVYLRLCEIPLPPVYGPTADSEARPEPDHQSQP